jgi:Cof subfamily protein (haloacid dehalogenase superfamily)
VSEQRIIRLLLADVDGTLVTQNKVLTRDAVAAAEALRRAHVILAITSGRPPLGMKMVIAPLALECPLAGFNGGVLANPDLTVIESHTLDPDAAGAALKIILDYGLDAWLYTPDQWLIRDQSAPHVAREAWTVDFQAQVRPDFTDDDMAHVVKIVGVSDDLDQVAACEAAVQEALGDHASAARSQPYYLDVTHPLANKGQVVATLARRLNISPENIATIGDMPNDVLMFAKSGFSIAMGNASDAVKAKASAVTSSNEDEGFARAVERFILPSASPGNRP